MEHFESWKDLVNPEFYIKLGGFWLVLLIVFAELGLFFGFFLPGDSLLFISGIYSTTIISETFGETGNDEIWKLLSNSVQKKNNFVDVYSELRNLYIEFRKDNEIKKKVNKIITEIKSTVTARTGISNVQECSINKIIHKQQLEKKINEFLNGIVTKSPQKNELLHGYQIQVNLTAKIGRASCRERV